MFSSWSIDLRAAGATMAAWPLLSLRGQNPRVRPVKYLLAVVVNLGDFHQGVQHGSRTD